MAWTRHGHQIPGTTVVEPKPTDRERCGATRGCPECRADALAILGNATTIYSTKNGSEERLDLIVGEPTDYVARAKMHVKSTVDGNFHPPQVPPPYELYVVWFAKTLDNWKALVGTTLADGAYYEVTHDGYKQVTYVDTYTKTGHRVSHEV